MKRIKLFEGENTLDFLDEKGSVIYSIRYESLNEYDISGTCKWILHLRRKSWAYSEMLYMVAKIICRLYPLNDFDWENTFFIVEKAEIDNGVDSLRSLIEKDLGNEEDFISKIRSANENNERDEILKIVDANLKHYGIYK